MLKYRVMLCDELEKCIGYTFKDKSLLRTAMTHSSYANDILGNSSFSNERFEFLGDALLDAVIGEILFRRYPEKDEGFLTKLRAEIVCEKSLSMAAFAVGLNKYLLLSKGEEERGGRNRESIVADSVEAVIAAVYLDSDMTQALASVYGIVKRLLDENIELACQGKLNIDSKSALQEKYQARGLGEPVYKIINESGPDHAKSFLAAVYLGGRELGRGKGRTKKEAEANAAAEALKLMEE